MLVFISSFFVTLDELFLWHGWPTKGIQPYFQPGPMPEILTVANFLQVASRIWTCAEPKFRLCWMKPCNSDNHYRTAPIIFLTNIESCWALNIIEYSWILRFHYEHKEFLNQNISSKNAAKKNTYIRTFCEILWKWP